VKPAVKPGVEPGSEAKIGQDKTKQKAKKSPAMPGFFFLAETSRI
jgi:hypothetical protein